MTMMHPKKTHCDQCWTEMNITPPRTLYLSGKQIMMKARINYSPRPILCNFSPFFANSSWPWHCATSSPAIT